MPQCRGDSLVLLRCSFVRGQVAKAGALGLLVLCGSNFEQFGSVSGLLGCGGGWGCGGGRARLLQRVTCPDRPVPLLLSWKNLIIEDALSPSPNCISFLYEKSS